MFILTTEAFPPMILAAPPVTVIKWALAWSCLQPLPAQRESQLFCWCYRYLIPRHLPGTTWWVPVCVCVWTSGLIQAEQQQPRCGGEPLCVGWELNIWPAPRVSSCPWYSCGCSLPESLSACSWLIALGAASLQKTFLHLTQCIVFNNEGQKTPWLSQWNNAVWEFLNFGRKKVFMCSAGFCLCHQRLTLFIILDSLCCCCCCSQLICVSEELF